MAAMMVDKDARALHAMSGDLSAHEWATRLEADVLDIKRYCTAHALPLRGGGEASSEEQLLRALEEAYASASP